ncbi:MAG: LD-carboxypeptidase [Gammaproteobacteria bacterium]
MNWTPLKAGDIVDLVAPASPLKDKAQLEGILAFIRSLGLVPRYHDEILSQVSDSHLPYHSNTDASRLKQLQTALYATDSQAIWCVRGGYGSMKLLPGLSALVPPQKSKLLIGFSDITMLHLFLNQQWGWETVHGEMLSRWCAPEVRTKMQHLIDVIFGKAKQLQYTGLKPLNQPAENKPTIRAPIIVGNLSLFQASLGTPWQLNPKDKILILEEVNENAYRIDRILEQFKQSKVLSGVKAIIFGDMATKVTEEESSLIDRMLIDFAKSHTFPIYQMKEIGHGDMNHPLPFGGEGVIGSDLRLTCRFRS